MNAIVATMNAICVAPAQKCHFTGRIRWKSTLQKVTKRMLNMNSGRILSHTGPAHAPNESNAGVLAKNR